MPARISTDIDEACRVLRAGGLCGIPTETVYGLAGSAINPKAVAAIFEAKQRPFFDPLIVHVAELAQLQPLVRDMPAVAVCLAEKFWPGPLTLVLPKTDVVPDLVTAGLQNVAVRIPSHPMARELLRRLDLPLAAPSANLFGRTSPTTAEHVREQLGDRIDCILDGGPCAVGIESTIVQIRDGELPLLLRLGGITIEELETVLGAIEIPSDRDEQGSLSLDMARPAPGRLASHYAPQTPLIIVSNTRDWRDPQRTGRMLLGPLNAHEQSVCVPFAATEVLSPTSDLREAATNFFAALRRLDHCGLDQIIAEPFPELGLGRALNDRLRRAAHGSLR